MSGLSIEILLRAYRCGIFPMAETRASDELYWIEPKIRGLIPLDTFHLPKGVARLMRKGAFRLSVNQAFGRVIRACGSAEAGRKETWINDEIIDLYTRMHVEGYAHSIEVWNGGEAREAGALAGGLYGVAIGSAFFGESMFSFRPDASKVALAATAARLKAGGFTLFDVQFVTAHLQRFGAVKVAKEKYLLLLQKALAGNADFLKLPADAQPQRMLQEIAQTS
ncbi:MAG TPA: leucyl/phenylalanyl-tRNA--protein transferase [Sphingomonadales bacterium]|nr:leucyl/phenylalanyl-tRNA--protein transferase [Sphingomonadales bacterium]